MKRQQPSTVLQDTPREPFNLRLFPTNPRTLCLLQMFLALSFSSGAVAQKDTERRTNDNNPAYAGRLNAEPLNVLWDFGHVPIDYNMIYTLPLENSGADSLRILSVKSSCECTEPSVKVEFLAAGESSPLTVSYNTKNFYGPQSRFVEIHTSDPHTPQRIFQFRAIVGGRPAEVDMRPRSVFNLPGSGIDTIKIKNYADRRLDFAIVFQDTSLFHLDVPVKFVAPGGYAEIYLLPREDLSRGVYFSTVTLEFSANPPVRVSTPVKLVRY